MLVALTPCFTGNSTSNLIFDGVNECARQRLHRNSASKNLVRQTRKVGKPTMHDIIRVAANTVALKSHKVEVKQCIVSFVAGPGGGLQIAQRSER